MVIIKKKNWLISENSVTEKHLFLSRRKFLINVGKSVLFPLLYSPSVIASYNFNKSINKKYLLDTKNITDEKLATTYTNFYEFGSSKNIWRRARKLDTNNWVVKIDGLVRNKLDLNINELKRNFDLEERIYRFRCVEGWSMVIPWLGFPVNKIIKKVDPLKEAKYIRFETFFNPEIAPGQKQKWYPWPYVEGITLEEGINDLAFLATGMYGNDLPNQNGAPIRLVLPWKYGFKSIKSIVKISFVKEQPIGLWEKLAPLEYGFWANVNPNVPHPRWSQAKEKLLGKNEFQETKLFNGYEEQVNYLYKNLLKEKKSKLFR